MSGIAVSGFLCPLVSAAVITYGPTKYLQASDSPWHEGVQRGSIYLEDFTDGELNTPYVTSLTGGLAMTNDLRSVDADDGFIDNKGATGGSWSTIPFASNNGAFEFVFSRNAGGLLPAFVGMAVTHGAGNLDQMGIFGSDGQFLGSAAFDLSIVSQYSSVNYRNFVGEARFIGVYVPEGISRITLIRSDQIDHLQYGYAIPEPLNAALVLAGVLPFSRRRRALARLEVEAGTDSISNFVSVDV